MRMWHKQVACTAGSGTEYYSQESSSRPWHGVQYDGSNAYSIKEIVCIVRRNEDVRLLVDEHAVA
jgi:hypothetical protein